MSPSSYYRWLHEGRRLWLGGRRGQLRPDENFPVAAIVLGPILFAVAMLALLGALDLFLHLSSEKSLHRFFYASVGVIALACAVIHRGFTALAWNQRAARLRAGVASTPAPRPAWWVRWLLGPVYVLVISWVTPLALLGGIENLRGAITWKRVRTDLQAQGERLFLHEIIPASVPAEQNFASVPIFADLFVYGRQTNLINGKPVVSANRWLDTNALNRFHIFLLPERDLPDKKLRAEAQAARPVQLADWAAAFRTSISNRIEKEKLPPSRTGRGTPDFTPRYPAAPAGAGDATVVLTALAVADAELAPICEASQRPHARFNIHWDDGFSALLPHLGHLKSLNRFLGVRAQARLAAGDVTGAYADAQCSLRLVNVLREEPWLISLLVRLSQHTIAARTVWQGIESHQWTEAQLREFQQQLEAVDFLRDTAQALEGERSAAISTLDGWVADRRQLREGVDQLGITDGENVAQGMATSPTSSPMIPRGWIRQNQAALATFLQHGIDQTRRLATNTPPQGYVVDLRQFNALADAELNRLGSQTTPYSVFVRLLAPALDRAVMKGIRGSQLARMAATGCAVERYRLKHGSYPDGLAALVPEFVAEVPRDLMDRQPLRYARTDDGLFRLWSVGADGVDDGGVVRRASSLANSEQKGRVSDPQSRREERGLDWVWPN